MSACSRCGTGAWHPEVALCTRADCDMTAARVEMRKRPPNDRQPQGFGRMVKRAAAHEVENV